jgi:hypothetical protein
MQVTRNGPSQETNIRIDPLGRDRMKWLKSLFETLGVKPSYSVIVRRALAVYLSHTEKALGNDEELSLEVARLKAHSYGDRSPWKTPPVFDGRPFSKMLWEQQREQTRKHIKYHFGIDLPPAQGDSQAQGAFNE